MFQAGGYIYESIITRIDDGDTDLEKLHNENYKYILDLDELAAEGDDIPNVWSKKFGVCKYLQKILPNLYDEKDQHFNTKEIGRF